MKALLSLIISGALVVSGFGQTRNVLVGTNNAVVQPTNFWSADASNARIGLGLGTAATNPASAFQVSSATLSNLAAGSGASLTNIAASNIVGTLSIGRGGTGSTNASDARTALGLGTAATNPASAFQSSSANLTNLAANNGGSLTNLQATSLVGIIPSSNIATVNFSNLAGTLSIASGGTSATNAANARQNLGSTTVGDAVFIATNAAAARTAIGATTVGSSLFTLANPSAITFLRLNADNTASALSASDFRTALGLGTASTNPASAFQSSSLALTNLASGNGGALTNLQASNVTGTIAISNGGSGATTAGGARTNLGLGATWLTNTTASDFLSAIGLGSTNSAQFGGLAVGGNLAVVTNQIDFGSPVFFADRSGTNAVFLFEEASDAAIARTNLGLGWPALTNTNSGTALVSVDTNGEVVSPTNFWQAAPIATTLQNSVPEYVGTTISTNAATNARLLFLFSLSGVQTGVTNVITLPTNGSTFNGDVATITHSGPTSSVTAVRQLGASTNIITLNQPEEAVRFLYRNNQWTLMDNISYVEPIYFSGTNAAANAAASRTNLGLGTTNDVEFVSVALESIYRSGGTNKSIDVDDNALFSAITENVMLDWGGTNVLIWGPLAFNNVTNAAATRTNLGLGATNTVFFKSLTLTEDGGFSVGTIGTNSLLFSITQDGIAIEGSPSGPVFELIGTNIGPQILSDLALSSTNNVAFRNITSDGNIVISNQSATNNGILFVYRTNNEPFLGLANLIASNNTTVGNETLFRVGVAEATNKAAQFGFRSTNTNGDGVAVFSTFGYNALMMVGPSDRSRTNYATNTNAGIEADIWSVSPTNRVATLIDTNTGAFSLHRAIQFQTNDSSVGNTNLVPATNNQIQKWLRVYIGTNAYFLPLYQ